MTKTRTISLDKYLSPVPNNPRDNQLYIDKKEKSREKSFNKDNMLFDKKEQLDKVVEAFRRYSNSNKTLQKVVSKHEPGEPKRTEYLKVDKDKFNKDMEFWKKRNQQSAARERLKRKGAVPTKSGKKLFEDFVRDMKEATGNTKQQNIDDADLRNIYNAATQLDYDKWLWWIMDEYSSHI